MSTPSFATSPMILSANSSAYSLPVAPPRCLWRSATRIFSSSRFAPPASASYSASPIFPAFFNFFSTARRSFTASVTHITAGPSAECISSIRRARVRFQNPPIGFCSSPSSSLYACCSFTFHWRSMSRITRSCGPSASRVRLSAFHASDSFSLPAIASTIFA